MNILYICGLRMNILLDYIYMWTKNEYIVGLYICGLRMNILLYYKCGLRMNILLDYKFVD